MNNDDLKSLTKDDINDFITWFEEIKTKYRFDYLSSKFISETLLNNVNIDKNGKYIYNDLDENHHLKDLLNKWNEQITNEKITNEKYNNITTTERINEIRSKYNIPENNQENNLMEKFNSMIETNIDDSELVDKFKTMIDKNIDNSEDLNIKISSLKKNIAERHKRDEEINKNRTEQKINRDLEFEKEIEQIKTTNKLPETKKEQEYIDLEKKVLQERRDDGKVTMDKLLELENKMDELERLRRENKELSSVYNSSESRYNSLFSDRRLSQYPPPPQSYLHNRVPPPVKPNPTSNLDLYRQTNKNPPDYLYRTPTPVIPATPSLYSRSSLYDRPISNDYETSMNINRYPPRNPYDRISNTPYSNLYDRPISDRYMNPSSSLDNNTDYSTERLERLKQLREKLEKENGLSAIKEKENGLYTSKNEDTTADKSSETRTSIENRKKILQGIFEKIKDNKSGKITDDKKIEDNYSSEEYNFFINLDNQEKEYYLLIENSIRDHNKMDIPLRFKILDKDINLENKAIIIKKIDDHNKSKFSLGGENNKFNNWLTGLLKVPFGEYKYLPITKENTKEEICDYLLKSKKILDEAVFGHTTTKNQIIQLITQWITNPEAGGNVIGIQGPMGNGKTTLIKEGVSKAVDRPFAFITLGGCSDAAFLEGHHYTYEGSMWGRVVDILIQSQCMNPIFYFDELDKVSQTKRGDEIINMLIHLTDSSQNTEFQDKYFSGINIDLSKSIFIFSFNDPAKISPILLDRLLVIKTDGFEKEDKIAIAKDYLLPGLFTNIGLDQEKVEFSDGVLGHIMEKYTDENGVRTLKRCLELTISKLNVLLLTKGTDLFSYDINIDETPIKLTNDNIDTLLKEFYKDNEDKDRMEFAMYM